MFGCLKNSTQLLQWLQCNHMGQLQQSKLGWFLEKPNPYPFWEILRFLCDQKHKFNESHSEISQEVSCFRNMMVEMWVRTEDRKWFTSKNLKSHLWLFLIFESRSGNNSNHPPNKISESYPCWWKEAGVLAKKKQQKKRSYYLTKGSISVWNHVLNVRKLEWRPQWSVAKTSTFNGRNFHGWSWLPHRIILQPAREICGTDSKTSGKH